MTDDEAKIIIKAASGVLFDAISELLYKDPHSWSHRGCQTCRAISDIIGKPFGCYRYQIEHKERT